VVTRSRQIRPNPRKTQFAFTMKTGSKKGGQRETALVTHRKAMAHQSRYLKKKGGRKERESGKAGPGNDGKNSRLAGTSKVGGK